MGTNSVTAVSLKTGKTEWNTSFQASAGAPSGQAVIADQRLHIPLQSGQIWTLDVKSGKVINKLFNETHEQPLGNLIIQNGQFLSLSATGLVSYEQKQTFEAKIADIKQQKTQAPLALLKESEMLMMSHSYPEALSKLQQIDQKQLPAQYHDQLQKLTIKCLSSLIRSDFQKYDDLVDQLKQQVRSESEQIELQRLLFERYAANKQFPDAIPLLMELALTPEEIFFQTAATEAQIDSWIAGQATDLWKQATPTDREQFSLQIEQRAQHVINLKQRQQERFLQQFGFHQAAIPVLQKVIAASMNSGQFYEAELWLTRLVKQNEPQLAAQGLARMAELCLKFQLKQDAEYYLEQLAEYDPQLQIAENQTLQQFLEQKQQASLTKLAHDETKPWQPQQLKLIVEDLPAITPVRNSF